jgi:hypothetical protein
VRRVLGFLSLLVCASCVTYADRVAQPQPVTESGTDDTTPLPATGTVLVTTTGAPPPTPTPTNSVESVTTIVATIDTTTTGMPAARPSTTASAATRGPKC